MRRGAAVRGRGRNRPRASARAHNGFACAPHPAAPSNRVARAHGARGSSLELIAFKGNSTARSWSRYRLTCGARTACNCNWSPRRGLRLFPRAGTGANRVARAGAWLLVGTDQRARAGAPVAPSVVGRSEGRARRAQSRRPPRGAPLAL